jgi:hypothetical protein
VAAVVKTWLCLKPEARAAADPNQAPDEPLRAVAHGHEILDLAHPLRGQEPGDQDVGVRQIQLLGHRERVGGSDPVEPATAAIQQRPEHARRVEPLGAVPVDRPVGTDQRRAAQITDDPVLGNRQMVGHPTVLRGERFRVASR